MSHNRELTTEETEREFHRVALFAAGYHPEYFGEYPVPTQTPGGYTLCHRKLENYLSRSKAERDEVIGMYPEAGEDFLLFLRN